MRCVYNPLPEAELVAVCDLNPNALGRCRASIGARTAYDGLRELIADPEVEAVSVATPDFAHGRSSLAALRPASTSCARSRWRPPLEEAQTIVDAGGKDGGEADGRLPQPRQSGRSCRAEKRRGGEIGTPAAWLRATEQHDLRARSRC